MNFQVEFTSRSKKDLKNLPIDIQRIILKESLILESSPYPSKKKIKLIKGIKFRCYRLRIDTEYDTFRLFYGVEKNVVYVLRIVSKKDADKILKSIRKLDFTPNI